MTVPRSAARLLEAVLEHLDPALLGAAARAGDAGRDAHHRHQRLRRPRDEAHLKVPHKIGVPKKHKTVPPRPHSERMESPPSRQCSQPGPTKTTKTTTHGPHDGARLPHDGRGARVTWSSPLRTMYISEATSPWVYTGLCASVGSGRRAMQIRVTTSFFRPLKSGTCYQFMTPSVINLP
jgi:hypothetical protein